VRGRLGRAAGRRPCGRPAGDTIRKQGRTRMIGRCAVSFYKCLGKRDSRQTGPARKDSLRTGSGFEGKEPAWQILAAGIRESKRALCPWTLVETTAHRENSGGGRSCGTAEICWAQVNAGVRVAECLCSWAGEARAMPIPWSLRPAIIEYSEWLGGLACRVNPTPRRWRGPREGPRHFLSPRAARAGDGARWAFGEESL